MAKALRHKGTSTIVWVLMLLLLLGLGGFGVSNFGGSIRSIGAVGDQEIGVNDYARALSGEIDAISAQAGKPIPFTEAQAQGIDQVVRSQLIAAAAVDDEAARIGLSVGDAAVRDQIVNARGFQGLDGTFSRDTYQLALRQLGMTEGEFEERLRAEAARSMLQGAVAVGFGTPSVFADTVTRWATERRGFHYARLGPESLTAPVPAPTEDELAAFHTANPAPFTTPETRVISYAWLSPEMMLPEVQLDEEALKAAYQSRIAEFVQPERRLVERLVFEDEAAAAAAKARYDAGEASFADLAAARGLSLTDIDLGEASKDMLGAAGEAVFALTEPGVVGPLPSDLGPALYAMNGILEAQETSFEEARDQLSEEIAMDRARRMVADQAQSLEDLLAGGATLEQLAGETPMDFGTVEMTAEGGDGIAAYAAFRDAALAVKAEDFPTLAELEDGGLFALRLDTVKPPAVQPLAEVHDRAVELWTAAETGKRLTAEAEAIAAAPDFARALGERLLVSTAVAPIDRRGFVEGLPDGAVDVLFTMAEGETRALPDGDGAVVLHLDVIAGPEFGDTDAEQLRQALGTQARQSLAQDAVEAFTRDIAARAGITLNQAAINAVHARMQ